MTIHFAPPAVLNDGVVVPRRRWDSDEDQYRRIRLALSRQIPDREAVRTFARFAYNGGARCR